MHLTDNRRIRRERRERDSGLPSGDSERRQKLERRLPEEEASVLSYSDGQLYFCVSSKPSEKSESKMFPMADGLARGHLA